MDSTRKAVKRGTIGLVGGALVLALLVLARPEAAQLAEKPGASAQIVPLDIPEGTYLYFVFANTPEGKETEFGNWWDDHMGAIVHNLPGFVSGQRFIVQPRPGRPDQHFRHMAVYLIKGDPEAALGGIGPAIKAGKVTPTDRALMVENELALYRPAKPAFLGGAPPASE